MTSLKWKLTAIKTQFGYSGSAERGTAFGACGGGAQLQVINTSTIVVIETTLRCMHRKVALEIVAGIEFLGFFGGSHCPPPVLFV